MNQISFKKVAIAFLVLFVMSRTAKIIAWFQDYQGSRILTLEPLARSSQMSRYVATLALMLTAAIVIWEVMMRKK